MKNLYIIMAVLTAIFILPVTKNYLSGDELSGSSRKAVYASAKKVRGHIPPDERMLFDFSLGIVEEIKTVEGGEKAFLSAVGGLKPEEVIELAKKEAGAKIAARDGKFAQYKSWDDMLKKLTATNKSLRSQPDRPQGAL